jgi:hypothetical protein
VQDHGNVETLGQGFEVPVATTARPRGVEVSEAQGECALSRGGEADSRSFAERWTCHTTKGR